MYKFKQDLAMAYFDGCSKKTASRLLAREINLTTADGKQHTVRLLKQSDIFVN